MVMEKKWITLIWLVKKSFKIVRLIVCGPQSVTQDVKSLLILHRVQSEQPRSLILGPNGFPLIVFRIYGHHPQLIEIMALHTVAEAHVIKAICNIVEYQKNKPARL